MSDTVRSALCPKCGSPLPGGALEGLCPACLMSQATETGSGGGSGRGFVPPPLAELGKLFPQLNILSLLGAGGMGAVYKARQPALDRFVALKILPPTMAGGVNFEQRFNREARALARLNHPNIVAVYEFGQAGGLHYFIMEYVDGTNLRQLTAHSRIGPREAMQIVPQICEALQYAHDEGVVHRDIKPENVLVDRKGRVKIADFGIARIVDADPEEQRLTAEGQVIGTPHYMAPEQLERPLSVDHRADIYSLGVVFYELLTGDLPLGKFAPPSRKVSVDVRLDEVVLRALENDPERRYQHASEVHSELQTISSTAAPGGAPAEPKREIAPRYVRWAGFAVVVDRGGEREIRWNGALGLIGTAALLNALAMLLFRWIAGQEYPGTYSIPFLITLVIVSAGLRWAMQAPEHRLEPGVEKEDGTLVFPHQQTFRFDRSHAALAGVLVAVLSWMLLQHYGFPVLRGAWAGRTLTSQTADLVPNEHVLRVALPKDGQLEVLAIGYPGAQQQGWWRPDGSPVTNDWYTMQITSPSLFAGRVERDVILRMDLPEGADGLFYESDASSSYTATTQVTQNGKAEGRLMGVRLALDPMAKKVDLRVGVALEPWRVVGTRKPDSQSKGFDWRRNEPRWDLALHHLSQTSDGVQVTLIAPKPNRDWSTRLVAVDTQGVTHSYNLGNGTPAGDSFAWTYEFNNLKLAQIREFQIQVRPIHWVSFPNLMVEPSSPVALGGASPSDSVRSLLHLASVSCKPALGEFSR